MVSVKVILMSYERFILMVLLRVKDVVWVEKMQHQLKIDLQIVQLQEPGSQLFIMLEFVLQRRNNSISGNINI